MRLIRSIRNFGPALVLAGLVMGLFGGCVSDEAEINLGNVLPVSGPFFKEQHSTVKPDGSVVSGYHLVHKSSSGRMKRLAYVSNQNEPPKLFTFRFYGKNIVYTTLSTTTARGRTFTTEQLMLCTESGSKMMLDRNLLDFRFVGPTDEGIRCRFPIEDTGREDILYSAKTLSDY